jgi:hypothetical protein
VVRRTESNVSGNLFGGNYGPDSTMIAIGSGAEGMLMSLIYIALECLWLRIGP